MTAALNNSTKYSSTVCAPTQVLYSFQTREALDLLRIDNHDATPEHAAEPDENDNAAEPNEDTADARLVLSAAYLAVTRNATRQTRSPGTDIPARQRSTPPQNEEPMTPTTSPPPLRMTKMDEYRLTHIDAKHAIAFVSLRIKKVYDSHHKPMFFDVRDLVNLRLHREYRVSAVWSKKIGSQLVGPFKILERIGRLAYQLELSANMKIHDVVSVA